MTDEEVRLRATCERVLQMGHRQRRWCSGVAVVGLMLLSGGTPMSAQSMALDLDDLETTVRRFIGADAEEASG